MLPYPVLFERRGEYVAHVKLTVAVAPDGPARRLAGPPASNPHPELNLPPAAVAAEGGGGVVADGGRRLGGKRRREGGTMTDEEGGGGAAGEDEGLARMDRCRPGSRAHTHVHMTCVHARSHAEARALAQRRTTDHVQAGGVSAACS